MSLSTFVKLSYGLNPAELVPVSVQPMNEQQREIAQEVVLPKRCFDNSIQLAMHLDATYVLGVYQSIIPIEHAWLKVGDTYIDPTLETVIGDVSGEYLSLMEVKASELMDLVEAIQRYSGDDAAYPPMFHTIRTFPEFSHLFISNKDRLRFLSCESL
ncbi:TPA: hypothetical protein KDZ97_003637 [Vibrio parahaemolyticus]|nr:hypothetical protein [Vibrio parahaemolyticus]MDF5646667.1 hypothetical protein [Vibrio parahaemolyticus]MDF5666074.1 hypothetical protein [Vibrio parahaemolyticus]WKV19324.1 hypothetical protein [Vibrio parahaemolyticus]HBC3404766.1 hypothetical protein [Vibrio parahaemolyticus]HBC3539103.1 hypothetical protein [Vibrio parahaemolyticus]